MWVTSWTSVQMTEGDYGIDLPFNFADITFSSTDTIRFTVKTAPNASAALLEKDFIATNPIALNLTEAETALFPVGNYVYSVDWFRSGTFLYNLVANASFKVVDKI